MFCLFGDREPCPTWDDVCGPAVVDLLRPAYNVYGDKDYECLTGLSVSHLAVPGRRSHEFAQLLDPLRNSAPKQASRSLVKCPGKACEW